MAAAQSQGKNVGTPLYIFKETLRQFSAVFMAAKTVIFDKMLGQLLRHLYRQEQLF